ncbi:hypothetical protein [Marmoricola sp. URHA0025 HA25]
MLLDVTTAVALGRVSLEEGLEDLARTAGWSAPSSSAVVAGGRRELLGELAAGGSQVARVGVHDAGMVLAARHNALDGLAMLTATGRLLGCDLRSSARGVGADRPRAVGTAAARGWEVTVRPQARVAASGEPAPGDSFAVIRVDGTPRTADLVRAGARAVVAWNRAHRVPARRVTVAVGVSTVGATSGALADRSAFLRLRNVEGLELDEIRDLLAHAPLQPGGSERAGSAIVTAVAKTGVRILAGRLGSTLLVSHLGQVEAPAEVDELAFYPVTGGGSGLSLGAVTLRDRTTLTFRARASRHDDEGLRQLLALVVEELDRAPDQPA